MERSNMGVLVLLSGGVDSAGCLIWAKERYKRVGAVTLDYGQMHSREIQSAKELSAFMEIPLTILPLPFMREIGGGSLTTHIPETDPTNRHEQFPDLPTNFVPLRNLIFVSVGAALAIKCNMRRLVVGANLTDFQDYPDCRPDFFIYLQQTINLALGASDPNLPAKNLIFFLPISSASDFLIYAPWTRMEKYEILKYILDRPIGKHLLSLTHTCYNNEYPPCGICGACVERANGFDKLGVEDPLITYFKEGGIKWEEPK